MKYTNKFNLPEPIYRAISNDPYFDGGADISTTRIISPYQAEMTPDFHPFRRRVHFIPGNEASIQPLLAELEFIVDKTKWGFPFRRGLFAIGENDFRRIAQAMGVNIDQYK